MVNGTKYSPMQFIKFGSYRQHDAQSKEPIEWVVLEANDQDALLVSRYGLDCKKYHRYWADIAWENCDLRKWLNDEFLNEAFSEEELQRIKLSEVVNDDNPKHRIRGGNNTQDRVFCLSLAEAERYFKNDSERRCQPTDLAIAHWAFVSDDGHCWWWLRSPGFNQYHTSGVYAAGSLDPDGVCVDGDHYVVRPALRLIWESAAAV
ncbi:DUF6273 domain-containing protein [Succinimonas sp.]|uniref:DUF6273 domain-containing protein n=1 Tax=Succinimonas sp. TaxID=1936151 RepID=UPI0038685043